MRQSIAVTLLLALTACAAPEPAPATNPDPVEPGGGAEEEGSGPSFAADVQTMCDAPHAIADRLASLTVEHQWRHIAEYLDGELRTEEGREFFASFANASPADCATMLRRAEGAPEPCALAERFDAQAASFASEGTLDDAGE